MRSLYVRNTGKQQSWGPGWVPKFSEDNLSPSVGVCSDGGRGLCCLPNSALHTTPGLFVGTDGMPRTHPSGLRAQVGEHWCPTWPLPPTALTSDSHTVGFRAIRSSSSSVQLCPGSRRTVTSANCWACLRQCPPPPELKLGPSSAQGPPSPKSTSATSEQPHFPSSPCHLGA